MTYKVVKPFQIKAYGKLVELKEGARIDIPEEKATQLVESGKIVPAEEHKKGNIGEKIRQEGEETKQQEIPEILNERMAIMGEECDPEQINPYITDFGVLVIPFNSPKKYYYWNGGQSVCDTLKEVGRCDLIEKYKSNYSN